MAANAKDTKELSPNSCRIGDYVYLESSSTSPYTIGRIEELNRLANGNVETKILCFFRRRDIPAPLLVLADKHDTGIVGKTGDKLPSDHGDENGDVTLASENKAEKAPETNGSKTKDEDTDDGLTPEQRHHVKHRELFLSRQVESFPVTAIRGKCFVTLLNETESLLSYLNKEDTFFYSLVYDPQQKTLLADRGEIRVGTKYQADPVALSVKPDGVCDRKPEELETLVWNPESPLTDAEIDQFIVLAKSVGTFARAADPSSSVKLPGLHMSAAAASRDTTALQAMRLLHENNYDFGRAVQALLPSTGPLLCRDEMEDWSGSEASLFEEAMNKYGKDFNDIRSYFLPWKSLKNIVEFYYLWKTTDWYVLQRRIKVVENESKLKHVTPPNVVPKGNDLVLANGANDGVVGTGASRVPCESCSVTFANLWWAFGASRTRRLCEKCWAYWRKFGGLPNPKAQADGFGAKADNSEPDVSMTILVDGEGQFGCKECGKVFSRQDKLFVHVEMHHSGQNLLNKAGTYSEFHQ
jgi:metastasis-associated protein MTA